MARKNLIWCDEETLSKDISGKVYIETGANSGVGLETTRQAVPKNVTGFTWKISTTSNESLIILMPTARQK